MARWLPRRWSVAAMVIWWGSWLDAYMRRLEEFPRGVSPIGTGWREALGDLRRVADWTELFSRQVGEQPWRQVLNVWWPRLLPGVAAAATHGVIRVGHAVRALLADGEDDSHLAGLLTWPPALAGFSVPAEPEQIRALLAGLVDAATLQYLFYGHGNGIMLVHSATAPSAVLRTLPALEAGLWAPSLAAAWAASSALTAVYAPAEPASREELPEAPAGQSRDQTAADTFARAVEHGDEHVIKFADTAVEVFARTCDPDAIAAAIRAAELIEA